MRASNYYRAAEFYVRDDPQDPRSLRGWQSSHDCFAEAARLADPPPFEAVEIPYEGTTLPGYFFRVDDSGKQRPTVITMTGMDGYQEETYSQAFNALAHSARSLERISKEARLFTRLLDSTSWVAKEEVPFAVSCVMSWSASMI
jgi:hypothetical protein